MLRTAFEVGSESFSSPQKLDCEISEIVATRPAKSLVRSSHHARRPCWWEIRIIILILESLGWVIIVTGCGWVRFQGSFISPELEKGSEHRRTQRWKEDFQTTSSTARARFPSPYFWVYFCHRMSLERTSPSMAEGQVGVLRGNPRARGEAMSSRYLSRPL